ncbi:MAG: hypothetical protein AAF846_04835 [Chloroflexota bacterium]
MASACASSSSCAGENNKCDASLARKFARLSYEPGVLVTSLQGGEVSLPRTLLPTDEQQRLTYKELPFTGRELTTFDKIFLTIFFAGVTDGNEPAYAWVNVGANRLRELLDKIAQNTSFNFNEYATLVKVGHGVLTSDELDYVKKQFLFGEHYTHLRIFQHKVDELKHIKTEIEASDPATTQAPFIVGQFTRFIVGVVAAFGVDDEELVLSIAQKLARLSDSPAPLNLSYIGQDVTDEMIVLDNSQHATFDALSFSDAERDAFDKLFLLAYVGSHDSNTRANYAWINIRLDRLGALLAQGYSGNRFNLSNYVTLAEYGFEEPSQDMWDSVQKKYFFHTDRINVRLYPPLSEVANSDSKQITHDVSQSELLFGRLTHYKMGIISFFGVDDEALVLSIAQKLARLSDTPTPLSVSYMGEEPSDDIIALENDKPTSIDALKFTDEERGIFGNIFIIGYAISASIEDKPVYAWMNTRLDRFDSVFEQADSGVLYNLRMHTTVIRDGIGAPTDEEWEAVQRDYLFGMDRTNVRIFPPLDETLSQFEDDKELDKSDD